MLSIGMPADSWTGIREAASATCAPGEPWSFRVLWGAMNQCSGDRDEEAAKLFSNISLCYGRMGEWNRAGGPADAAISLWPAWPKARYRMAEALSHTGPHHPALVQARKARENAPADEVKDIAALQVRVLSRALVAAGMKLSAFDTFDPEAGGEAEREHYQALVQIERDVFRALPDWKEQVEATLFPELFPDGKGAWDTEDQKLRFQAYTAVLCRDKPSLQEETAWLTWATLTSRQIRTGLEKLLGAECV